MAPSGAFLIMTNKPSTNTRWPFPLDKDFLDDDQDPKKKKTSIIHWGAYACIAFAFIGTPLLLGFNLLQTMFTPIEYKKTPKEVQNCAAISKALAGADAVQERVFDACLRGEWR